MDKAIKTAIDVFIEKDGKFLLGKRKGAYGDGTWAFPGGHLEYGEKLADCARRELFEETGMTADDFKFRTVLNLKNFNKHYVIIGFSAINPRGEPTVKEPERCSEWGWFSLDALPTEVYEPHKPHMELLRNGQMLFED